ncbi:YgaP family membrane protein [Methylomonas methanica]|jgi:hypothetical protein|uniref:Inner membrane protein YgaP-like transmembrane domain-containing protein n=1 Tax=Methylomonas methanica (strain DSM 25384 / MC09) TaxID=857087 RepID=G0A2H5_METMM|nr:DUF2892 domain-containing protein [Methylomonas methanica]AEG00155.1 hypothetical protein Metme_1737 [Methylomonas methanica MC09]
MNFDYKRMLKFEHNVGAKDKKIRLISGVVLLTASLFTASIFFLLVGLVLVATSYFGWCPAYSGFGKSTCDVTDVVSDAVSDVKEKIEE